MKLMDTARDIWSRLEALADALDYDAYADIVSRFERLERDGRSRQVQMKALSEEVLNLSEQVRQGPRQAL